MRNECHDAESPAQCISFVISFLLVFFPPIIYRPELFILNRRYLWNIKQIALITTYDLTADFFPKPQANIACSTSSLLTTSNKRYMEFHIVSTRFRCCYFLFRCSILETMTQQKPGRCLVLICEHYHKSSNSSPPRISPPLE